MKKLLLTVFYFGFSSLSAQEKEPIQISGVYPHLTMWNSENECGTGAVVLWQNDLWAVTYAPHAPRGSSDKLYQITPSLEQIIFEGSVGGTPANRMIHRETNQLLIGPYLINAEKKIRTIPQTDMLGRLTANARHLKNPETMIYYATMEEGLYEVDLKTLAVKCLIRDGHAEEGEGVPSKLPGYHGKGMYSSQGRVVYANNGETGSDVRTDPTVPSGALGQWFGEGDWQLVRRNQFTEVTGPGGVFGNENPESDPIWAMGWDAKSLILALLENNEWHYFRLPKGSHSYDGAHGWNTEWPRIREIGEGDDLLATMHGTFWKFPKTFSLKNSAGIAPRSNYLKVIGDFCRWEDRVVFGCDDSAKAEFLNTRDFKAKHAAPVQSNSNLWFVTPEKLDDIGPLIGRGSVWLREDVAANTPSDPFLASGYERRQLSLAHGSDSEVSFVLEIDRVGNGEWERLPKMSVSPQSLYHHFLKEDGAWIRISTESDAKDVTAHFSFSNADPRDTMNDAIFAGLPKSGEPAATGGLMRSLAHDKLGLAAENEAGEFSGYYELNNKMELVPVEDAKAAAKLVKAVRQPEKSFEVDAASVIMIEDGKRYRLPMQRGFVEPKRSGKSDFKELSDFLGKSLTRDAKLAVSSTHLEYVSDHAIDGKIGDDDARWISANEAGPWIEVDFGEKKTIRQLWVVSGWKNETQYVVRNFDIQIPGENGEWETVNGGEIRDNAEIEREIDLPEAVTTQKFRLVAKDHGFLRFYEIAAFENALEIDPNQIGDFGPTRVCREVATERDLLNVFGTFYELPARNAQGLAKVRPIATHNLAVRDFCSHAGLLLFTGLSADAEGDRIFRSADGKAAVWAGVIDDLWKLGRPRGIGGPWNGHQVKAGVPSDPFLMTGYDKKSVTIKSTETTEITLEVDLDGTGVWVPHGAYPLKAGQTLSIVFPDGFSAYWVRAKSLVDTTATVMFEYE